MIDIWDLKKRKKLINYKIIAFDTENENEKVSLVNFFDGIKHHTFEIIDNDFLEVYKYIYSTRNIKNCVFVAHNLEYDLNNIFSHDEYSLLDKMFYSGKLIYATLQKFPHRFIDSFNFYQGSLKNMAESLGMVKGDFETAKLNLTENIKYCQNDTLILYRFMELLQENTNKKLKLTLPLTVGSLAIRDLITNHKKREFKSFNDPIFLNAYCGGRVEAFEIGTIENIHYMDFRSHYPSSMLKNFPDPEHIKENDNFKSEYGIIHAKIFIPNQKFGPLPKKIKGKLCFPSGIIEGFWTYHEVRNSIKNFNCEVLEIYQSFGTNVTCKPFESFVNYHYNERQIYKNANNEFGILYEKILMNSGYGKLIQHNEAMELTTKPKDEKEILETGAKLKKVLGPFYQYSIPQIEVHSFCNYIWGIYITSYARIELLNLMQEIEKSGQNVLYCDTDSIIYEVLKDKICYSHRIGKDLNEVDFESGEKIEIYGLKSYIFHSNGKLKIASKGVPNKLAIEYFRNKEVFINKPTKLIESYIQVNNKSKPNVWHDLKKVFTGNYDKRELKSNGKTEILQSFKSEYEREQFFLMIYKKMLNNSCFLK